MLVMRFQTDVRFRPAQPREGIVMPDVESQPIDTFSWGISRPERIVLEDYERLEGQFG
jgi:hypothetical protein